MSVFIEAKEVLNLQDIKQLQKCLSKGKIRTATVILYLACLRKYPNIDRLGLYRACLDKVKTKYEKTATA